MPDGVGISRLGKAQRYCLELGFQVHLQRIDVSIAVRQVRVVGLGHQVSRAEGEVLVDFITDLELVTA